MNDTEVRQILAHASVAGLHVTLPPGQLDRKTYTAVNDVLERLGGKWPPRDQPRTHARAPSCSRSRRSSIPARSRRRTPDAFFPTPLAVIQRMMLLANNTKFGSRLLEPSAGKGAILNYVRTWHGDMECVGVELNGLRATVLRHLGFNVDEADFLAWSTEARFDLVLMNPPFAVERDAAEWIAHVRHAHTLLAPGGALVSVVPNSYAHRRDRKHAEFRAWAEDRCPALLECIGRQFVNR